MELFLERIRGIGAGLLYALTLILIIGLPTTVIFCVCKFFIMDWLEISFLDSLAVFVILFVVLVIVLYALYHFIYSIFGFIYDIVNYLILEPFVKKLPSKEQLRREQNLKEERARKEAKGK